MDSQLPNESLKDFLHRRQRQLRQLVSAIQGQLIAAQTELEEVRHAMKAIGLQPGTPLSDMRPKSGLIGLGAAFDATAEVTLGADGPAPPLSADALDALLAEQPTIKELVVLALTNHFRDDGASPEQLREYFLVAHGRDVERTSLSPQLTRLKEDGVIKQKDDGTYRFTEKWKAAQAKPPIVRRRV